MKKTLLFFPQTTFRFLLFVSALMLFSNAFATHLAGGEIGYTCIGPRKWAITLNVYRYCDNGATPLCASFSCPQTITAMPSSGGLNPNGCSANPSSVSAVLQLISVEDVGKSNVARCGASAKNGCDNMGQVVPGSYRPSMEKYVFRGVLDLSLPSLNNACPYWEIGWSYCCRNSTVNIQGQPNFFIKTIFHIFDGAGAAGSCKNSSPKFLNEPLSVYCANKLANINPGAVDPDNDELTFKVVKASLAADTLVAYNAPFNEAWPFPLVSTLPPHSDYPGQPFLVVDSVTGDITFNPSNNTTQPISGSVNIQVSQWGYQEIPAGSGNKVRYLKGITYRDILLMSGPCVGNNTPYIETVPAMAGGKPKGNWTVCAGEKICFQVLAKDSDFNLTAIDTTFLSWNQAIVRGPGVVSFKPVYDSLTPRPREDAYEFCWQTSEADGSPFPYVFTVTGVDSRCPEPGRVLKSFAITVLPKDSAIQNISQPAGTLVQQALYDYAVKALSDVDYAWSIDNGTIVGSDSSAKVSVKWNTGQGSLKLIQKLGDCIDSVTFAVNVSSVGLKDQPALSNLLIRPNPNKGLFILEGDDLQDAKIAVINLLGQTVVDAQKMPVNGVIDVRNLAEGVYYLNVMKQEKSTVLKLVIR